MTSLTQIDFDSKYAEGLAKLSLPNQEVEPAASSPRSHHTPPRPKPKPRIVDEVEAATVH